MASIRIQTVHSIQEIEPAVWDKVASTRGFQSHRWYAFGEQVMADCPPTYLVAWDGETPVAGAALFKIKNTHAKQSRSAHKTKRRIIRNRFKFIFM